MTWKQQLEQMRAQIRGHGKVVEELHGKFEAGTLSAEDHTRFQQALDGADAIRNSKEFKDLVATEQRSVRASGLMTFAAGSGQARGASGGGAGSTPPEDGDDDEENQSPSFGRQIRSGQPGGAMGGARQTGEGQRRSNLQGGTPGNPSNAPAGFMRSNRGDLGGGTDEEYTRAFWAWAIRGERNIGREQREVLRAGPLSFDGETRSQNTQSFGDGGVLAPPQLADRILIAQRQLFGPQNVGATILPSGKGTRIVVPLLDDSEGAAYIVGEDQNDSASQTQLSFRGTAIDMFKYGTHSVVITEEMIEDGMFGIEQIVASQLARRLNYSIARDTTIGDGVNKPAGLITELLSAGWVTNTATNDTFAAGDIGRLSLAVGDLHRESPEFRLGMSSSILRGQVMQFRSTTGEPLYRAPDNGPPGTIDGYQFGFMSFMAKTVVDQAVIMTGGDHSRYMIRLGTDIRIRRFDQVPEAANVDGIALKAFQRAGGALGRDSINADSRPLAALRVQ